MRRRHSIYWKLLLLVGGFCMAMIWATDRIGRHIDRQTSYLSSEARATLAGWGEEATAAVERGPDAVARWAADLAAREASWIVVVDRHLQPLDGRELSIDELRRLTFVRNYEWPMSRRSRGRPLVAVPLGDEGTQLVVQLPQRFMPWRNHALLSALNLYVLPAVLSGLFCWLLYAMLISPLDRLRRKAGALRENDLDAFLPAAFAQRRDELGELGRSLDGLTRRLRESLAQQRQLLRDLSHELRTPLARLRVASESDLPPEELRGRVAREIAAMQSLVDDTLELAWLDSERPRLDCAPVDVAALWDVVAEDARFESGWPRHRLRAELPEACRVHAHLNTLARAIENVVRNAIRHSPPDGQVRLHARRDGAHWLLGIDDDGPGVAEDALRTIFRPFTRLAAARPGGDGFGLGLSIARHVVDLQHGEMWAENRPEGGLCVWFRLPAA